MGTWNYDDTYKADTYKGITTKEHDSGSLRGTIISADIPIDGFKIGFEVENSSPTKGDSINLGDYTTYMIKVGHRIFALKDKIRCDWTINYFNREYNHYSVEEQISGIMTEVGCIWNISDRMSLNGSIRLGLGNSTGNFDNYIAMMSWVKAKFNYMLNNNFGLAIEYRDFVVD